MVITDGPVDPRSRLFVGRAEELKTLQTWLVNTACVGAVLGARQTGKTSLLFKLRHSLRQKYAFAFVDLQSVEGADVRECFSYIASEINGQVRSDTTRDLLLPGNSSEFLAFLRQLSDDARAVRVIVILDELGALPPATALKLASAIRALFTSRLIRPEYARYVVVLAGAADMLELTTGRNSPLRNVTETIYLGDLSLGETAQLLERVLGRARHELSPQLTHCLHGWTGGHPYWTQLLAGALKESGAVSEERISGIVEDLLRTENKNLPHVFRSLQEDSQLSNIVELLLDGVTVAFSRVDPAVARLELIGLVKNQDGRCAIRNKIYSEALRRAQTRPRRFSSNDLRHLSQLLAEGTNRQRVLQLAAEELRRLLQNRSVVIFGKTPDNLHYSPLAYVGIPLDVAQRAEFAVDSRIVPPHGSPFEPDKANLSKDELQHLRDLGGTVIVPMRQKGQPIGFFCLGRKLSNEKYEPQDLEFVSAASDQVVSSLERIHLVEIERDAERARVIQEGLLPKQLPQLGSVQIAARWQPARMVGGDYYDVLAVAQQKIAVCIGDVVGKGIPAALMMANLQAAVKTLASEATAPSVLCSELNTLMVGNVGIGKFITFFYGVFDGRTRTLVYTNAGHNPPILVRASGESRRLHEGGALLGVLPDWSYQQAALELSSGDRLLLFTDGASEAQSPEGKEFGEERLTELLRQYRHLNAGELQDKILESVTLFSGGNFHDDVTSVLLAVV